MFKTLISLMILSLSLQAQVIDIGGIDVFGKVAQEVFQAATKSDEILSQVKKVEEQYQAKCTKENYTIILLGTANRLRFKANCYSESKKIKLIMGIKFKRNDSQVDFEIKKVKIKLI